MACAGVRTVLQRRCKLGSGDSEHVIIWTQLDHAQVIRPAILREGFEAVKLGNLEVTDDVSIVEAIGRPVKMTQGAYTNLKVSLSTVRLFHHGYECVARQTCADDVAVSAPHPVQMVDRKRVQVTTPEDMAVAERLLSPQS